MSARYPCNRPEKPAHEPELFPAVSLAGSALVSLSLLLAIVVMLWALFELMAWSQPAKFSERWWPYETPKFHDVQNHLPRAPLMLWGRSVVT